MKKIGVVIFVVALLFIAGISYITISSGSDKIITPWDDSSNNSNTNVSGTPNNPSVDGVWGAEIILMFSDGSNESLKKIVDDSEGLLGFFSQLLSIKHGDKDVTSIHYLLHAKASGSMNTEVSIDLSGFTVSFNSYDNFYSNSLVNSIEASGSGIETIPLDDSWHTILDISKNADEVIPSNLGVNAYTVRLQPGGSLSYDPGTGTYIDAQLPDPVEFTLVKTEDTDDNDDYQINVEFKSGYKIY